MTTWSAVIFSIEPTSRGLETGVAITDGVSQKFTERFQSDGSLTSLRNQVRARVAVVEEIHAKPEYGVGDLLDLAPDPIITPPKPVDPEPPTAEEIARSTFVTAYQRAKAMQRAVSIGLFGAGDPVVKDAMALAKSLYLTDYETLL